MITAIVDRGPSRATVLRSKKIESHYVEGSHHEMRNEHIYVSCIFCLHDLRRTNCQRSNRLQKHASGGKRITGSVSLRDRETG